MSPRFIPGIATQSLGRAPHHDLPKRLHAAARHSMRSIEIFYEDLVHLSTSLPPAAPGTTFPTSTQSQEQLVAAADRIAQICSSNALQVICLQPFMHYDGLLSASAHADRIQELSFWIVLAQHLGTDLIQIPSSFLPETECTGCQTRLVADLREVADIGLTYEPPIRFAYEALCWGTHVDTWQAAWSVVKAVDRPNFGTCLDTFNICGRVYADPASADGTNVTAEADMALSVALLRSELSEGDNIRKVFYVEVCDGERLDAPLVQGHPWYRADQPARMSWSRNARLFPFEEERAGYLPWREVFGAILDAGYEGFVSFELFSRTGYETGDSVAEEHAIRAERSWKLLEKWIEERQQKTKSGKLAPMMQQDSVLPVFVKSVPLSRVPKRAWSSLDVMESRL